MAIKNKKLNWRRLATRALHDKKTIDMTMSRNTNNRQPHERFVRQRVAKTARMQNLFSSLIKKSAMAVSMALAAIELMRGQAA